MNYSYKCLLVRDIGDYVFHVQLNRPKQLNALDPVLWEEIGRVFVQLDEDPDCRAVILSGNGRAFCSGIDLVAYASALGKDDDMDAARKARELLRVLEKMQWSFTQIEKCCKPVIGAIHGHCIGGALDMICGCDIRYCSNDAMFSSKEVAVGFAADIGSLNRMPKIIGNHSWLREITMTSRGFGAKEAHEQGFVSRVFDSYDALIAAATDTAKLIASNTPVAVQGTKIVLNYARDHSVDESLRYVAMWNMSQLQTNDVAESAAAVFNRGTKPEYAKL